MSVTLLPHRVIRVAAVQWGDWEVGLNGGASVPLGVAIENWDQATEMVFSSGCSVELDAVAECLGVRRPSVVALVGVIDCRATLQRFVARQHLDEGGHAQVTLRVPPGAVSESLVVSLHLVLANPVAGLVAPAPVRPGSRVAASERLAVQLEAGTVQFPTESFSFAAAGFEDVPWKLQLDTSDWDAPFPSAVRLCVNTDHASGLALLDPSHPLFEPLTSVVKVSVVAQMMGAVASVKIPDVDDLHEDSLLVGLGHVAQVWLRQDLASAAQLASADPTTFWTLLSERAKLLKGLP